MKTIIRTKNTVQMALSKLKECNEFLDKSLEEIESKTGESEKTSDAVGHSTAVKQNEAEDDCFTDTTLGMDLIPDITVNDIKTSIK